MAVTQQHYDNEDQQTRIINGLTTNNLAINSQPD